MRYKLLLSYYGVGYNGWQIQKDKLTIQQVVGDVVSKVLNTPTKVTASGRTDTDVSALAQVAHFDFEGQLPKNFVGYCNSLLPNTISFLNVEKAENFHAQHDAKRKTYEYKFYTGTCRNAYLDQFAYYAKCKLDETKLTQCVKYLVGEHDFSAFCAANTSVVDKVRTIYSAQIDKNNGVYTFRISGNGFLYNMVRIIVGTCIMIASSDLEPDIMAKIIKSKDRKNAGKTVPAKALTLVGVEY